MKTILSMLAAATVLTAAPVAAQGGGYYRATLATSPARPMLVTRDVAWRCADTTCTAPRGGARDAVMCELVARAAGTLTGFTANGVALDAAALEKCNARAK